MALKVRSHQELSVWSVKEDNRSSRNWQDSAIKLNYNLTNCYVNLHLIKGLKKRNISSSPVELTAPSKYSNPGAQSFSPYGTRASAWPAFKKNSVAFFSLVLRGIFFTLIILRIDLRKNKQYIFLNAHYLTRYLWKNKRLSFASSCINTDIYGHTITKKLHAWCQLRLRWRHQRIWITMTFWGTCRLFLKTLTVKTRSNGCEEAAEIFAMDLSECLAWQGVPFNANLDKTGW